MTAKELRQKYLDFFQSKGHTIIPSASLIPENDSSVLFTTAGMHPLVPYLLGENHPGGKRVVNVQKCIRTSDIDEVGNAKHHTFFEMLGNWSFGDYFKKEAIEWSWEFLADKKWLGLDKNRLAVSVFVGDEDAPFDQEAFDFWKNLGIPEKRIAKLPKKNNWWGMEKGPCGPNTEMFYWAGSPDEVPESFNDDNALWVEIWNDVFMQYDKTANGKYNPLFQKDVDTGMGIERTLASLNGFDDNYKTELFWPIIEKLEEISGIKYEERKKSFRIIADHIKAATMIIGDEKGIIPSNVGQGYVVRKLIRRAIRHGKHLGINKNFTQILAEKVVEIYKDTYAEIEKNKSKILEELGGEENKFRKNLNNGLKENFKYFFGGEIIDVDKTTGNTSFISGKINIEDIKNKISGKYLFKMFSEKGFPPEFVEEEIIGILERRNFNINEVNEIEEKFKKELGVFNEELKKHQELSRTASAGMFKGGLADTGEKTTKLHTAAHLMLAALWKVLGTDVIQRGSNITEERLRFDFSHNAKMTPEQIAEVEKIVNEQIQKKLPVICKEMTLEEAKKQGAMGIFESKYGEKVKVYTIGNFSQEICGGPHVQNTGELGKFKIKKEESSSAGVRRIKAVLE
jgi:alanyl-tRNA synthetase